MDHIRMKSTWWTKLKFDNSNGYVFLTLFWEAKCVSKCTIYLIYIRLQGNQISVESRFFVNLQECYHGFTQPTTFNAIFFSFLRKNCKRHSFYPPPSIFCKWIYAKLNSSMQIIDMKIANFELLMWYSPFRI